MEGFMQWLREFLVIADSIVFMLICAYGFGFTLACLIFGPPKWLKLD